MIDMREIKLDLRYPESRQEDITDAFTRGYIGAVEVSNKAIEKLKAENEKLWEALAETLARLSAANEIAGGGFMDARYCELLSELGIEVA